MWSSHDYDPNCRPVIGLPWTHKSHDNNASTNAEDPVKGAIMIATGCLGYSLFYTLHAITLKSYPTGLSLTAMVCSLGALIGTIVTFLSGNTSVWALGWDAKLLAYVYGGVIPSGITYYLSAVIMKEKGPVFVTAFNPLNMHQQQSKAETNINDDSKTDLEMKC
ncbi:wat1-related protein at2g39510 [Phtheirospermum japonicum]|uniref:Wat1-related protein at2g39510 n=1 Tax=Phtheirospermum japonicum TaxID=374723 RepID=A0A830BEQ8_9LAMI|nr:wat1-related protein at2g39510 [Phtheirospermum japonicum]